MQKGFSKDQRFTSNALKHLIDQSKERILQIDQSKHLQHHVDRIQDYIFIGTSFAKMPSKMGIKEKLSRFVHIACPNMPLQHALIYSITLCI